MKRLLFPLLFLVSVSLTPAQGSRLLRQPTMFGESIVFVYADDLWSVSSAGGDAIRLTTAEGVETNPHFSPDGNWIAFTGQYAGNTDVYLIPSRGGEPQRLTYHPGADIVQGWMPGGAAVIFRSGREAYPTSEGKFYTVPVHGGTPEPLPIPRAYAGEVSPDGQYAAYQPVGFWDPEWRNYRGGQAKPIWIVDFETMSLTTVPQPDRERHTDPTWLDDDIYFLSERDYANNIWRYTPSSGDLVQITFHSDFDVKSLDASDKAIVYEQGGYLHVFDPAKGTSEQLVINATGDFSGIRDKWVDIQPGGLSNASLSPTGKRALFEFRGEILTIPAENGSLRNLTANSEAADRYPAWSPDGKYIAWFSDASGEYQLMIASQDGLSESRSIELPNPTFFFAPQWSPDGKHIAFTDTDYNLWIVNTETGNAVRADTDRFAHPIRTLQPVWSPDSKWIAYSRLLDSQLKAIFVYNVATAEKHQITDGMADAVSPSWDESGKYLYFLASTNFGLNTGWLDMSAYDRPYTRAVYAIVLSADEPSPFLPESDEEATDTPDDEAPADKKAEPSEAEKSIQVKIDFEALETRILAVDVPVRPYTSLFAGPEGFFFYTESPNAQFTTGETLHRYSLKDRKAITFLENVNTAVLSFDRKKLLYRSGSNWAITGTAGGPAKPGEGRLSFSGSQIQVDPQAEWKQIFREGWRYQRDFLYVDNVHGAPWNDVYEWYHPWVDHVRHRSDLNYVVDILGGEVAVGHSYTSGGDLPRVSSTPVGLLGADFEVVDSRFRISRIYTGENWNPDVSAPLAGPGIDVKTGDFLLAVNGVPITGADNLFRVFEGTANKQTVLTVSPSIREADARMVTVVPVSNEGALRSWAWVEDNRKWVDEQSDGKLAYVWVPNTGFGGYAYFNRYYFAQQHKKGAVIDQRNNGGGSAADYIADVLARDLHGYFNSKAGDRRPFTTPMAGLWGPKVMIINERAGSGGDLLPYLFRRMDIGTLVGTRTWGGLVGTWDTPPFVDGGRMVAPRGGFFDVDGEWAVEGEGISPDIEVLQDPKLVADGRDPQLERAVAEALRLLETEEVILKPEPAPPVRWRRPTKN